MASINFPDFLNSLLIKPSPKVLVGESLLQQLPLTYYDRDIFIQLQKINYHSFTLLFLTQLYNIFTRRETSYTFFAKGGLAFAYLSKQIDTPDIDIQVELPPSITTNEDILKAAKTIQEFVVYFCSRSSLAVPNGKFIDPVFNARDVDYNNRLEEPVLVRNPRGGIFAVYIARRLVGRFHYIKLNIVIRLQTDLGEVQENIFELIFPTEQTPSQRIELQGYAYHELAEQFIQNAFNRMQILQNAVNNYNELLVSMVHEAGQKNPIDYLLPVEQEKRNYVATTKIKIINSFVRFIYIFRLVLTMNKNPNYPYYLDKMKIAYNKFYERFTELLTNGYLSIYCFLMEPLLGELESIFSIYDKMYNNPGKIQTVIPIFHETCASSIPRLYSFSKEQLQGLEGSLFPKGKKANNNNNNKAAGGGGGGANAPPALPLPGGGGSGANAPPALPLPGGGGGGANAPPALPLPGGGGGGANAPLKSGKSRKRGVSTPLKSGVNAPLKSGVSTPLKSGVNAPPAILSASPLAPNAPPAKESIAEKLARQEEQEKNLEELYREQELILQQQSDKEAEEEWVNVPIGMKQQVIEEQEGRAEEMKPRINYRTLLEQKRQEKEEARKKQAEREAENARIKRKKAGAVAKSKAQAEAKAKEASNAFLNEAHAEAQAKRGAVKGFPYVFISEPDVTNLQPFEFKGVEVLRNPIVGQIQELVEDVFPQSAILYMSRNPFIPSQIYFGEHENVPVFFENALINDLYFTVHKIFNSFLQTIEQQRGIVQDVLTIPVFSDFYQYFIKAIQNIKLHFKEGSPKIGMCDEIIKALHEKKFDLSSNIDVVFEIYKLYWEKYIDFLFIICEYILELYPEYIIEDDFKITRKIIQDIFQTFINIKRDYKKKTLSVFFKVPDVTKAQAKLKELIIKVRSTSLARFMKHIQKYKKIKALQSGEDPEKVGPTFLFEPTPPSTSQDEIQKMQIYLFNTYELMPINKLFYNESPFIRNFVPLLPEKLNEELMSGQYDLIMFDIMLKYSKFIWNIPEIQNNNNNNNNNSNNSNNNTTSNNNSVKNIPEERKPILRRLFIFIFTILKEGSFLAWQSTVCINSEDEFKKILPRLLEASIDEKIQVQIGKGKTPEEAEIFVIAQLAQSYLMEEGDRIYGNFNLKQDKEPEFRLEEAREARKEIRARIAKQVKKSIAQMVKDGIALQGGRRIPKKKTYKGKRKQKINKSKRFTRRRS